MTPRDPHPEYPSRERWEVEYAAEHGEWPDVQNMTRIEASLADMPKPGDPDFDEREAAWLAGAPMCECGEPECSGRTCDPTQFDGAWDYLYDEHLNTIEYAHDEDPSTEGDES